MCVAVRPRGQSPCWRPEARARSDPAELSVDCPALSGEWRSSLEARARAELAMKQLTNGRLQIRCAAARVVVEFVPASGSSQRRDASLTGQPKAFVEQILSTWMASGNRTTGKVACRSPERS